MNSLEPGAAIVSNTMICEVSRLLQPSGSDDDARGWHGRRRKEVQIMDLLSLIEASVLHEVLYTLPCRLSNDADELVFRQALIQGDILRELDTSSAHEPIAQSILNGLQAVQNPVAVAGSASHIGQPIEFSTEMRRDLEEFLLVLDPEESAKRMRERVDSAKKYGVATPHMPPLLDDSIDYFGEGGGSAQPLHADSFEGFGKALIGWIDYHSSGAYEHCTSIVRDMYYIFASEHFELPYWPEALRMDFTRRFPNYFDKALHVQLYKRLADTFKTTVTDLYDDHAAELVFIPPFAALVLERSKSVEELLIRILELRQEYSKLRQSFDDLERKRRVGRSIDERLRFRRLQRTLLNEAGSAFERPSSLSLEGVIRYVPNIVNPVAKPFDPTKYSADLLLLPAKALLNWWVRRPISRLFDLADKLREIERYETLCTKLFGDDLDLHWA